MKKQILSFFLLFTSSYLFPCDCPPLQPVSKDLCKTYNVIFYGKVDSVSSCGKDGISTAYFTINELYKGAVSKEVKVDFDCASACLMSFEKGEEWLMYATYQKFDLLTVTICDHSRKHFDDESKDFYSIAAQRTFDQEKLFLKTELGIQPFVIKNDLNEQQKIFKPHNDQPSDINKLWLLLISLGTMGIVFLLARKRK